MPDAATPDLAPPPVQPQGPPLLQTIPQRADFLRAAKARRQGTPGFLLQARRRGPSERAAQAAIRFGLTCSKKLGNAVTRNRARRRLRALARTVLPEAGRPGWDYVLVGRPEATVAREFAALLADLRNALARVHRPGSASPADPLPKTALPAVPPPADTASGAVRPDAARPPSAEFPTVAPPHAPRSDTAPFSTAMGATDPPASAAVPGLDPADTAPAAGTPSVDASPAPATLPGARRSAAAPAAARTSRSAPRNGP